MWGRRLRRLAAVVLLLVAVSCGGARGVDTTAPPEPATEAEMVAFCEMYESVSSRSWDEMTAALIEVSPDEIKAEMVRTSQPPGDGWEEDREAVEDFIERCSEL